MYAKFYKYEIGEIGIAEEDGFITRIYFTKDILPKDIIFFETPLILEASVQIESYFNGKLKDFILPLAPLGTDFMKRTWKSLVKIPYGKTATYKDIAEEIGHPKAYRAVGLANNRNPIPIIIPCHRVIGSDGSLIGYRGGLDLKKKLLDLERRAVENENI